MLKATIHGSRSKDEKPSYLHHHVVKQARSITLNIGVGRDTHTYIVLPRHPGTRGPHTISLFTEDGAAALKPLSRLGRSADCSRHCSQTRKPLHSNVPSLRSGCWPSVSTK